MAAHSLTGIAKWEYNQTDLEVDVEAEARGLGIYKQKIEFILSRDHQNKSPEKTTEVELQLSLQRKCKKGRFLLLLIVNRHDNGQLTIIYIMYN